MAMADLWDAPLEATSTSEVADSLAAHSSSKTLYSANRPANCPMKHALCWKRLLQRKGKCPWLRSSGALVRFAHGPGKLERERPWLSPANAAEVLWYRGFSFVPSTAMQPHRDGVCAH